MTEAINPAFAEYHEYNSKRLALLEQLAVMTNIVIKMDTKTLQESSLTELNERMIMYDKIIQIHKDINDVLFQLKVTYRCILLNFAN